MRDTADLPPCDRCHSVAWGAIDPERHPLMLGIWGSHVVVCGRCGAIRLPHELLGEEP